MSPHAFLVLSISSLIISSTTAAAAELKLDRTFTAKPDASIRGGGLLPSGKLITWGHELLEWDLTTGKSRRLAKGPFEAGCVVDGGVAVQKAGNLLVRLRPPGWRAEFIDNNIHLSDCLWTTLLGQPGLLLIHRNAQVRHYKAPAAIPVATTARRRWEYQEIYSIYTDSRQTGLAAKDVDRDGRPDIFCGNYWIQSPDSYGLPWRLFAIQPYYQQPDAATITLIPIWSGIVAGQRERAEPVFSLFTPGEDVRQLWVEHRLKGPVRNPRALAEWRGGLVVGENSGDGRSRLLWIADARAVPIEIAPSAGVMVLVPAGGSLLAIETKRILVLSALPR